jgi:hypothetical protein
VFPGSSLWAASVCIAGKEIVLTRNINNDHLRQEVCLGRHELVIVQEEQSSSVACITYGNVEKLSAFIRGRYELSLSEPLLGGEKIFTTVAARHAE